MKARARPLTKAAPTISSGRPEVLTVSEAGDVSAAIGAPTGSTGSAGAAAITSGSTAAAPSSGGSIGGGIGGRSVTWRILVEDADVNQPSQALSHDTGESANTGLISVADRPWKAMLEEMAKTNHGIYDVLLSKRPPFAWDDARMKVK